MDGVFRWSGLVGEEGRDEGEETRVDWAVCLFRWEWGMRACRREAPVRSGWAREGVLGAAEACPSVSGDLLVLRAWRANFNKEWL